MKNFNLDNYVTIKGFNKMNLKERIDITNTMLKEYDLQIVNKHLGIDLDYFYYMFGYKFKNNKFVQK